jgi:hypothetical protein
MLRTNSKKYLNNIQTYLIDSVKTEDLLWKLHDAITDAEKIAFVMACYDSEFNHKFNRYKYPNEQTRFANWLAGLPSVLDIPFYNDDIINLAKELQEVETYAEKMEQRICDNYFNFMSYHILKLNSKLNK